MHKCREEVGKKECDVCILLDRIEMGQLDDAIEDILAAGHDRKRELRHGKRRLHGPHI